MAARLAKTLALGALVFGSALASASKTCDAILRGVGSAHVRKSYADVATHVRLVADDGRVLMRLYQSRDIRHCGFVNVGWMGEASLGAIHTFLREVYRHHPVESVQTVLRIAGPFGRKPTVLRGTRGNWPSLARNLWEFRVRSWVGRGDQAFRIYVTALKSSVPQLSLWGAPRHGHSNGQEVGLHLPVTSLDDAEFRRHLARLIRSTAAEAVVRQNADAYLDAIVKTKRP